ncbi:hypothetical protein Tco_0986513 [Tanacetum coccineum]
MDMALPPRELRHWFLRYEGLDYPDTDISDFEGMLMEHRDEASVSVFISRAWRRMLDIRGPLVHKLILEFFSTFRFGQVILDLDTPGTLQFQLGGARMRMSWKGFILALGLHMEEEMQTTRLIACSIAGRSQAPEKVTVTDLFLSERDGQHFGLLTAEILGGLTVIASELPIIDMTELPDAAAGTPDDAENASIVDEGGQADPAPEQVPQQPPLLPPDHARTMPQRMSRLEEDVHEIRWGLTEQREVIDAMARDFSRFSTWVTTGLGWMMDMAGVVYTPYAQTHVSYQRRVRQRTGEASTSATQQDPQQPDP